MDKNRILEEGLLVQYLLGELSTDDAAMVSKALLDDAELMQEYQVLESNFEKIAFENAIAPPSSVKIALKKKMEALLTAGAPVHHLNETVKNKSMVARLMVAASLAAVFGLSSFWLYTKWQDSEQNLMVLQQQTQLLQNRLANLEKNYKDTNGKYSFVNNPYVTPLVLKGTQSKAIAYVNHELKEVAVNSQGLPPLESDKTYQMWADVDGEMISMGIVSSNKEFIKLRYIDKAESLNITIEPAGGNHHATVENLISSISL